MTSLVHQLKGQLKLEVAIDETFSVLGNQETLLVGRCSTSLHGSPTSITEHPISSTDVFFARKSLEPLRMERYEYFGGLALPNTSNHVQGSVDTPTVEVDEHWATPQSHLIQSRDQDLLTPPFLRRDVAIARNGFAIEQLDEVFIPIWFLLNKDQMNLSMTLLNCRSTSRPQREYGRAGASVGVLTRPSEGINE